MSDEPTQNADAIVNLAGKIMRSHAESVEAGLSKPIGQQADLTKQVVRYEATEIVTNSKPQSEENQTSNKANTSEK